MQYYSTNKSAPSVDFKTATIAGQAPDKGLYFPEHIPVFPKKIIENIEGYSNTDIAFEAIKPFVGNCIPDDVLHNIVKETINFSIPLMPINNDIQSLELFHGPTLAFKDVGARFMSRCLSFFLKNEQQKVTVLVATSGDTGGAVANGFFNVPNIDVVILYPSGKVSKVQEQQLTTLGGNIHALEIQGNFDDCQQLVKKAFTDADVTSKLFLTSANSINVARWLPQQFYYFFGYKQWTDKNNAPVIAVPSGNFGNICAGLIAQASGLPITHFIAACNANNTVPNYMANHTYKPQKAIATISNAMDVGDPSNFIRIRTLLAHADKNIHTILSSESISDNITKATIKNVFEQFHYLLDPHTAVGYAALSNYLQQHPSKKGMVISTAHPVKFYDVVTPIIGQPIHLPSIVQSQMNAIKKSTLLPNEYDALKNCLLQLI
ncbi:threonine synthase [Ferruginibacter yonginensis]|uniref:Threonine synthase n=1 Tax=Ferruginibacter yonginensis TaxID=1310416 RepID=A0ABV8QTB8_9BACT